ncbi:MAG: TonB-dependent receptor [Woeseiaceae bacterium]
MTICGALLGAGYAYADVTDDGAAARIEEIIVTAQRREQNMQDIGASITVISGARFQELSFRTVTDLSEQVPNLTFATPAGESTLLALSIRGIGLNDLSDSNEGPVAIYVDDVYVGILTAQAGQLYDLERVEVVRGPQGTLYGRNTTGGLVHFVTRLPGAELDGYAEIAVGNDSRLKFEAAVGGSLSDRVSGRISVLHDSDDGYQVNRTTGQSFGTKDISSLRAQLRLFASERLDINLMAFTSRTDNRPTLYKARGLLTNTGERCTDPQIIARECFDGFGYRDPVNNPHSVELFPDIIGPRQEIDNDGGSVTINWRKDILTLKSITAASRVDKVDWDGSFANPNDLFQSGQLLDAEQFSQELRAGWSTPSADYVLGLFYYSDNKSGGIPFNSPFDYDTDFDQDTDAYALFGHGEWQLLERWAISLGARYSRERKKLDFLVPPSTVAGAGLAFQDDLDTDNVSWNIGVNWSPSDSMLLFANLAHGFKSGGWNAGGFVVIEEQITPFDDEEVDMFELGIKTDFLDKRLRINSTAFYYDYQDMQAFTQADVNGLPLSALTNVGGADIYGFEVEGLWHPTEALEASFGIGWLDTSTKDFFSFEGLTLGGEPIIEDLSGGELVLAPRFTANGIVRHSTPLANGELLAQIDFSYSDSYFFDTDNAPLDVSDSATLWNARLAWRLSSDKFEIALFGRNLTDEEKVIEGFDIFDTQMLIYNHARIYGVSLVYRI